jgi:hypothetical protein
VMSAAIPISFVASDGSWDNELLIGPPNSAHGHEQRFDPTHPDAEFKMLQLGSSCQRNPETSTVRSSSAMGAKCAPTNLAKRSSVEHR